MRSPEFIAHFGRFRHCLPHYVILPRILFRSSVRTARPEEAKGALETRLRCLALCLDCGRMPFKTTCSFGQHQSSLPIPHFRTELPDGQQPKRHAALGCTAGHVGSAICISTGTRLTGHFVGLSIATAVSLRSVSLNRFTHPVKLDVPFLINIAF